MRFVFRIVRSFWNLTGTSLALLPSKRYDNSNHQSRGLETSRDLTIRHLIGYWNGPVVFNCLNTTLSHHLPCLCCTRMRHHETSRDLAIRRLIKYWNGPPVPNCLNTTVNHPLPMLTPHTNATLSQRDSSLNMQCFQCIRYHLACLYNTIPAPAISHVLQCQLGASSGAPWYPSAKALLMTLSADILLNICIIAILRWEADIKPLALTTPSKWYHSIGVVVRFFPLCLLYCSRPISLLWWRTSLTHLWWQTHHHSNLVLRIALSRRPSNQQLYMDCSDFYGIIASPPK